ncbi:ArsA family ATPase [Oceanobacillus indicireducens]|uniref:Arsenic-transporting ATPase n=1 Tax=Oceanobacillus indicireducens TaxID=1004261 RepID=A0A917XVD2_9BACI|nr:ArsA family ATPase [Oceanobacillus indicireducens]GGN53301.1 arsenic-transporting ATPase [Oceanobacillus indicireducens]
MLNDTKKILFIGGKGGVGKSTSASAIAWKLAAAGKKTLLISTDPAHNLGDIFSVKIGGEARRIVSNLYALEIDPEYETTKYINSVKANIKGVVHSSMADEVYRQLDTAKASPGADEAALFDKLISIIIEGSEDYDHLVFDTAPTGHTIRLLTLPELMGVWIEGMLKKRKKTNENYVQLLNDGEPIEDPIYEVLLERKNRFGKAREILLNQNKTGFIFVLNPERLPILETKKAIDLLAKYDLHVRTVVVNKILPEEADGAFLIKRKEYEKRYLKQIQHTFKQQKLIHVPLLSQDITNLEQLNTFSNYY